MTLPRLHLFELNDSAWAPEPLRETIVESLSRTLAWGRILRGIAPELAEFLDRSGAREILDLCAGAGAPAAILAGELRQMRRTPPRFVLTDLQPHVESWQRLAREHPDCIDFVAEPVDATRIPPALSEGRARVVINALHHFRPELAGAILRDAARSSCGVFVVEGFERGPLGFAPFAAAGLPALLANPILAPHHKLAKAAMTWLSPIALAASIWDGVVSTMRVYTEAELRAMVAPSDFKWTYGTYDFFPGGRGYWFWGVPTS